MEYLQVNDQTTEGEEEDKQGPEQLASDGAAGVEDLEDDYEVEDENNNTDDTAGVVANIFQHV